MELSPPRLECDALLRYSVGMRTVLIALLLTAAASTAEAADDRRAAPKSAPLPKQTSGNPCAAFGPGFVQVEGGGTCVKIGGALEVGVGGSSRR